MSENALIDFSVLIVAYNNENSIGACLSSILRNDLKPHEILVLDNASTDSTIAKLGEFKEIRLVRSDRNIGFAAGINKLAGLATAEYLFMLNPDCELPPTSFSYLRKFCLTHRGAVAPALIYPDGSIQLSARRFPDHKNLLFSRKSPLSILGFFDLSSAGYLDLRSAAKVPAVAATAFIISRRIFGNLGGFDERFFLYFEDMDFCKRLNAAGIDIWYVPELRVKHSLGASSGCLDFRALLHHHRSAHLYFAKHYPERIFSNLALGLLLICGFLVTAVIKTVKAVWRR